MKIIKTICKKSFVKTISLYVVLPVIAFSISYATVYAWTHNVLPMWSVDSGKHMDWNGSTKYSTAFNNGVNIWNGYKSGVIRKDGAFTILDVTIADTTNLGTNIVAQTQHTVSSGHGKSYIYFATKYMDNLNATKQKVVAAHELGHSLGLNENKYLSYVMMYAYIDSSTNTGTLDAEDKENYNWMYNNKY